MPSTPHAADSGTRDCSSCGTAVAVDANFCSHCGTPLDEPSLPAYCSTCGEPFDHDDEFCTHCGTARTEPATRSSQPSRSPSDRRSSSSSPGPSPRPDHTESSSRGDSTESARAANGDDDSADPTGAASDSDAYEAFRRRVQRHLHDGWEIEHDYGDRVTLVDRDIGSIPVHVLLLLFTGGLGNLLYGWYHYSECARTRHLSVDDPAPEPTADTAADRRPPTETTQTDDGELVTASSYVLGIFMALIGLMLLVAGLSAGTIVLSLIGLALTASGLYIVPAVHRRLERRHGLTAFGRRRTVDHRVVQPHEQCAESCVVCGGPVESGLVRRRRDETVLAGVPVKTHAMEYNHYCLSCARAELVDSTDDLEAVATDGPTVGGEEHLEAELDSLLEDDDSTSEPSVTETPATEPPADDAPNTSDAATETR
ncbi:zinc-ribbon domain-containing protein [Salinadaptatus halalkaliphilus]|uniref:Zinc-ribbon domain-containing protein n=1 Tax=Salinadaptatus halalkaliphilus TaxID=2419781 RepID=A0A4S3TML3_9EURY|nr:zinc ribbon domain-containing protein [Salinadaptatus halalkaliphilus]THE65462.1 zinc-ribbon domain-containing protein [Salinadaptatus halalkaliphilus]